MARLWHDVVTAVRMLARTPAVTAAALLTLALGTGVNTAVYSIVDAVLLRSLPFPDAEALLQVWRTELPRLQYGSASYARYLDWRARNRVFTELGAYAPAPRTLTGRDTVAERVATGRATASFFTALGAAPLAGRYPDARDDQPGGDPVVVLGEQWWRGRFGADPTIIGESLTLDGVAHTVIGIAPAGYAEMWRVDAWTPLALAADPAARNDNYLVVVGRLRPGLDRAGAERGLTALAAEMATVSPLDRYGFTTLSLHDVLTRGSRQGLWILLGATGLVLLIACANVSNLLLARAVDRRREMAVRTAMGAGRGRLTAQLVTEAVVLSLAGGVAGVALAGGLLRVVVALVPTGVPRLGAVGLDLRVLAVSLAVATLAGVLSGVLPALHAAAADPGDTLRGTASRGATAAGARTASRLLVVAEIALSLMLVAASGLLVRSLQALGAQDLGFSTAGVLTFAVTVPAEADAAAGSARAVRVFEAIVERIARAPGVEAAGAVSLLPIAQTGNNGPIRVPERTIRPEESPLAELRAVTPGYFAAIGQPLVAGRGLDPRDGADAPPVVLLNETLAAQLWPRVPLRDVVGRRVGLGADRDGAWREVVGIVRDTRTRRPELPPDAETYVPHAQLRVRTLSLVVRGAGDPARLAPVVRAAVADVDPTLAVAALRPFADVIEGANRPARLTTLLTTGFGVLALGLAAIGIYSVLSHAVVRRTRELGVRAALGASPSSLMRLVLREGVVLTGFGMLGGAAGAIGLSSVLVGVLYQVSPTDPLVLAGAGVTVATVAALGYLVPAWRAAGVAPAVALRVE